MSDNRITNPTPKASTHLNYKGNCTAEAVGQIMGPNTMGELLTVVEAAYDPAADKTRLGLAYGVHFPRAVPTDV